MVGLRSANIWASLDWKIDSSYAFHGDCAAGKSGRIDMAWEGREIGEPFPIITRAVERESSRCSRDPVDRTKTR
jgi:hypothetical protein